MGNIPEREAEKLLRVAEHRAGPGGEAEHELGAGAVLGEAAEWKVGGDLGEEAAPHLIEVVRGGC